MSIQIRRADERFTTEADGKLTRHSFSYGAHYDPTNISFGPIRAINAEHLAPGAGYAAHRHSDVDIVTWVLSGTLGHADSAGGTGQVRPGVAQRLSAGAGAEHTEFNASATEPLVFIQMMLASDRDGPPEYASAEVPNVTGRPVNTVDVFAAASLRVLRLERGQFVTLPASNRCLVHISSGSVRLGEFVLATGDEMRLTDAGAQSFRGRSQTAEALIWLIGE